MPFLLAFIKELVSANFSDIVYQITVVFLLPINSALNPFLFSSLPDKLVALCRLRRSTKLFSFNRQQTPSSSSRNTTSFSISSLPDKRWDNLRREFDSRLGRLHSTHTFRWLET